MICLIAAHDKHYVIGKDGWMPWTLPEDLAHFKKVTLHHDILLGRTTFEAMGKPLPKRHTYVASSNEALEYADESVTMVRHLDMFLQEWKQKEATLFVCGGAMIYEKALPYADEMWISLVDGTYEGDTFFPKYDTNDFQIISIEGKAGFAIYHYRRKE